jgi:hypothetical protein
VTGTVDLNVPMGFVPEDEFPGYPGAGPWFFNGIHIADVSAHDAVNNTITVTPVPVPPGDIPAANLSTPPVWTSTQVQSRFSLEDGQWWYSEGTARVRIEGPPDAAMYNETTGVFTLPLTPIPTGAATVPAMGDELTFLQNVSMSRQDLMDASIVTTDADGNLWFNADPGDPGSIPIRIVSFMPNSATARAMIIPDAMMTSDIAAMLAALPAAATAAVGAGTDRNNDPTQPSKIVVNFDANVSRLDIKEDGGMITFIDPLTGIGREYRYLNAEMTYIKDANGVVTGARAILTISPETPIPQNIINDTSGRLEVRIGQTTDFKGIPYYLAKMNEMVRTLASGFNYGTNMKGGQLKDVTGHVNAYDANNMNMGMLFFTYQKLVNVDGRLTFLDAICYENDNDGHGNRNPLHVNANGGFVNSEFQIFRLNALNFKVNSNLLHSPFLMANAAREQANLIGNPQGSTPNNTGISENTAVFGFINMLNDKTLFREGTIGDFLIGIAGELGVDTRQAIKFENNYKDVTASVDYQRMSVSGVSIDEEITDMIRFQQQFIAATKLINVIDQIYDTLINRLGIR